MGELTPPPIEGRLFHAPDALPERSTSTTGVVGAGGLGAMMLVGGLILWVLTAVDVARNGFPWPIPRGQFGLYAMILAMPALGAFVLVAVRDRRRAFRERLAAAEDMEQRAGDADLTEDTAGP